MDQKLAVLFMPDDMTLTKEQAPLMLRPILFCPILTWMVEELMGRGIERFFIVSDKRAHDMMRPYVPENADVVYVDGARHGEELLTLLKDEKGSVLIVNGAVLPVGVFSGGAVYSADAKECCKVLKEHGAFAAFPKGAEITKGFLPVGDDEELRSAQDMCRRKIADKHFAAGVSIMDPNNTYIDPRVKIGSGTVILPGTILRGRTVIGKNCTIGPNAMIRDCTVGDETEVNASQLNCGERINFGCGTVTTNYDGFKKFRCTIGDDAFIGCNTNLIAPVTVGNGSYIAAGSTITDEVPADSLAIARERQVNKPGWAEQWRAAHEKK